MKSITFRPLRRIKKTGKITVASYMGWHKVMTADYGKFNLVIDDEYKRLPNDEFVYNHNGEQLFFFDYNPVDIPVYNSETMNLLELHESNKPYGIIWQGMSCHVNYVARGMDCSGCPTFSYHTAELCEKYSDITQFEPLTVRTVVKWFGWFLYQLNNSYLQIGK